MSDEDRLRDYLRRTRSELLSTREQLQRAEDAVHEPVAIVSMACRYPGGVRTPEQLWDVVSSGRDAIGPFPDDRGWPLENLIDPDPNKQGTSYAGTGGFLYEAADFDAAPFGIAPREALTIDPQQRLLLQTAWEAFERAGIDPTSLTGRQVGVFVGIMYNDYGSRHRRAPDGFEGYVGLNSAASIASGRIAYTFGLQGPAVTVDTACSSSLVALHYAVQAIRRGDCDQAMVGGATVMATPNTFVEFSRQRGLSPDGRCKAYSAAADGTGWAEGVGLILVESLSYAREHGHRILATIRGTAVNSDGASTQLSAPNGAAQQRVIHAALADARLTAAEIDVVEGHGTGTPLGDPIEAGALAATYGKARRQLDLDFVRLGSIKSNIGHTQAAAGIAGIIKMTLALQRGVMPATLHADSPSPHLDWANSGLSLLAQSTAWSSESARRAAVSSFGISGTNAHVILEQSPDIVSSTQAHRSPLRAPVPLLLSAASRPALAAQARRLREHFFSEGSSQPVHDDQLIDTAHSLVHTRANLSHRAVVVVDSVAHLDAALAAVASDIPAPMVVHGEAFRDEQPVFVFPGQGGQWEGMAAELIAQSPEFASEIDRCADAFAAHLDRDLREILAGPITRVDEVQPALFAVMVGLAALWRSVGVTPAAVVGHSQGEIAAAYVAGVLDLQTAAAVVALRSKAVATLGDAGTMASIASDAAGINEILSNRFDFDGVTIAAANGPRATVVAGPRAALEKLVGEYEARDVAAKILAVGYSSHSPQVDPLREGLLRALGDITAQRGEVEFHSTVVAGPLSGERLVSDYWYDNLREPVRFSDTIVGLVDAGHRVFIEMGPHPVLAGPVSDISSDAIAIGSLRRDSGGMSQFLVAVGHAHASGVTVDWSRFTAGSQIDLPTYAFTESRYWLDADTSTVTDPSSVETGHPLLPFVLRTGDGGLVASGALPAGAEWARDHRIAERTVLPAAALVDLAVTAALQAGFSEIATLTLLEPITVGAGAVALQVTVTHGGGLVVYVRHDDEAPWRRVAVAVAVQSAATDTSMASPIETTTWEQVDVTSGRYDEVFGRANVHYGPSLRTLSDLRHDGRTATADITVSSAVLGYTVVPAALDGALQAIYLSKLIESMESTVFVPFEFTGIRVHLTGADRLRVRLSRSAETNSVGLRAVDATGRNVLSIDSVAFRELPEQRDGQPDSADAMTRREPVRPSASAQVPSTSAVSTTDLLDTVRGAVASLLGYDSASTVRADGRFRDIGIDSLTAVALRDHLSGVIGTPLPASLVFDYPTPRALTRHLTELISGAGHLDEVSSSKSNPELSGDGDGDGDGDDPIVIVSMGCHYPGGVDSPEDLWQLVASGSDATGDFPADRGWDLDNLFADDPDRPGTSYVRRGGFLHDAADFDAAFFEMNPREARATDPQQRLLLQTAWETVERAGIDPTSLRDTETGVYVGLIYTEYGSRARNQPGEHGGYLGTGSAGSVASGRIAYSLGLHGPAVTVDTACSSSLVALHMAAKALRDNECEMALVGGATVMATPDTFVEFSRQRGLSPDGRCRPFADSANGTGFSEGVGMLLVERLSRARRHGHPVLAVLRGSAVNSDGASNGLTAPNGPAQERVIRDALRAGGISPLHVDAVEAHGTGTMLGDPVEATAVINAYGDRGDREPLWLGSLKSNIGHTQAAAGVGGVIKMVQAMTHQTLPRTLHIDTPTSKVEWNGSVRLLTDNTPWPTGSHPRRFGVSAFGMSGTNAHVVFEEPPQLPALAAIEQSANDIAARPVVLILSAKTDTALAASASRLRTYLQAEFRGGAHEELAAVARALAATRARFDHRLAVVASTVDDAIDALDAVASGTQHDRVVTGRAVDTGAAPVFLYPGQGSQWGQMAVSLLRESSVFADRIIECSQALAPFTEWSLADRLGTGIFDSVDVVQPVLWATMVALTSVWESFGVVPAAVIGHSQGEIAAATAIGALDLSNAAAVVALRSQALRRLAGHGAMGSIAAPATEVTAVLDGEFDRVAIAAINGPRSTVIAGARSQVVEMLERFDAAGINARLIDVDYASHTDQVEQLAETLTSDLPTVALGQFKASCYSTVTGARVGADDAPFGPEYWYDNLRRPVLLDAAVRAASDAGHRVFIEVSPHPVLTPGVHGTLDEHLAEPDEVQVLGTLRRDDGGLTRLLASVAQAWVAGVDVDWVRHYDAEYGSMPAVPSLPGYAFDRRRHWLDAAEPVISSRVHPFIESVVELAESGQTVFSGVVSTTTTPWLTDHSVAGAVLIAGAVLADLAAVAGTTLDAPVVDELVLEAPLVLTDAPREIQVVVNVAADDGRRQLTIHSRQQRPAGAWTVHAVGVLGSRSATAIDDFPAIWPPTGLGALPVGGLYERLAERGYRYGHAFAGVRAASGNDSDIYADIELAQPPGYVTVPTVLDAALHTLGPAGWFPEDSTIRLPFVWAGVATRPVTSESFRAWLRRTENGVGLRLATTDGTVVADVAEIVLRPVDPAGLTDTQIQTIVWEPVADRPYLDNRDHTSIDGSVDPTAPLATQLARLAAQIDAALATEIATVVVRTDLAVAAIPGESPEPAAAAVWGLVRSAQSEAPGRVVIIDGDSPGTDDESRYAGTALATNEPQLAVRGDRILVPRLRRVPMGLDIAPTGPNEPDWQLRAGGTSAEDLEVLAPADSPRIRILEPGQVRVELRSVGLNFRDAMLALGMYPDAADLGLEGAGVVLEVGESVEGLAVGDSVMGLLGDGIGPVTVTDARLMVPIPRGLDFAAAAAIPTVFLTAYYALFELGDAQPGQSVLIHSAAGGVGGAAVQLAVAHGLTVYATASPSKWPALRAAGIAPERIANSRDLGFAEQLRDASGDGVDIVLNSLAGPFVDASLQLLRPTGRFIEMGKTDVRSNDAHPGYRAFDLAEAGPQRTGEMLVELTARIAAGELSAPPVTAWPVARAHEALRYLSSGRHIGKIVLTLPRVLDPNGTVLVTGAPGGVGSQVAEHMVAAHNVRRLLLVSRRGADSPQAQQLGARLRELGAHVDFVAVDVADYDALAAVVAGVSPDHQLTAIIHAAGVLDDATLANSSADRIEAVLRPKVTGAINLDRIARSEPIERSLAAFVLFSSAAGVVGNAGQSAYSAANVALDALALRRFHLGLPAVSIAWGLWSTGDSAMTEGLTDTDTDRIRRTGLLPFTPQEALREFDAALIADHPDVVAVRLDLAQLARLTDLPAPLRGLIAASSGAASEEPTRSVDVAALVVSAGKEDGRLLLRKTVLDTARVVLGHGLDGDVDNCTFKELGFDSLTSVELRNRLGRSTGLRLAPTIVFDHPTPEALTEHILDLLVPNHSAVVVPEDTISARPPAASVTPDLESADAQELFAFIDSQLR